jgi:hypothetical protein
MKFAPELTLPVIAVTIATLAGISNNSDEREHATRKHQGSIII